MSNRARNRDKLLNDLQGAHRLLVSASIASCECHTKSPTVAFHSADCRYYKLQCALENIESAIATVTSK